MENLRIDKKVYESVRVSNINFGPQHPSAHGVLRLIISTQGELVTSIDPQIGFLHRGTEKLIEYKTYTQALPYFDRLDYVSAMSMEHAFALSIENCLDVDITRRASLIRVIFCEVTRILNHLMAITTHAMDVGAITPFLWGFEEREKLMEFYERVSGARMHANYIRPGGVAIDLPLGFCDDLYAFTSNFSNRILEIEEILSYNRIWISRLRKVGLLTAKNAKELGFSGVLLRSTGIKHDLRVNTPYEVYSELSKKIPIGVVGDCYDRYLQRMREMKISTLMIRYCLENMVDGPVKIYEHKLFPPSKSEINHSMEALITHYKYFAKGYPVLKNELYTAVEAPKGEFGVYLVSSGTPKPFRCKIRAPGFFHLQGIHTMGRGHFISDIVAILGSQDIVFGEVDR